MPHMDTTFLICWNGYQCNFLTKKFQKKYNQMYLIIHDGCLSTAYLIYCKSGQDGDSLLYGIQRHIEIPYGD